MAEENDSRSLTKEQKEQVEQKLREIRRGIRVTKITATRSIKGPRGDSFVGFSATWQSVQDDYSGPGADVMPDAEQEASYAEQGLPLSDAKLARYMLSMEADLAALESAVANGGITADFYEKSVKAVKTNYNALVLKALKVKPDEHT